MKMLRPLDDKNSKKDAMVDQINVTHDLWDELDLHIAHFENKSEDLIKG